MTSRLARVVAAILCLGSAATALCDETEIRLPNRTFDPPAGVESKLRDRLASPTLTEPVQAIVQLHRLPSPQELRELRALGVQLGSNVGEATFLARIKPRTNLDSIPRVRWAGLLLPQDKISEELWSLAQQAPSGTAMLLVAVHFQDGVAPESARELILQNSPIEQTYGSLSTYALGIPRNALESLAMQPSVRWVEAIARESFPLPAP